MDDGPFGASLLNLISVALFFGAQNIVFSLAKIPIIILQDILIEHWRHQLRMVLLAG
jgi:hypothetical protein